MSELSSFSGCFQGFDVAAFVFHSVAPYEALAKALGAQDRVAWLWHIDAYAIVLEH